LLTELKNLKIPASLDDRAVAQIREEHGKLMSDYNASLEKLKQDEEKMFAEHRQKEEQVKDGGERLALLQGVGMGDYNFRGKLAVVNGNRECSIFGKIECSVFRNSSTSFSVTMMQHFL